MSDKNGSNPFKNEEIMDIEENNEDIENNTEDNPEEISDAVEEKTEETDKLKQDYETLKNQYVRLMADFENHRKRQVAEKENLLKFGTENALTKMIEVLDNFERAKKSLENVEDIEKYKESIDLLQKQVIESLNKMGLETIEAQGKEFDPNFHEAVMRTPTDEFEENTIISELQKGYKFGEKVLRPTLVNVASPEQ